MFNRLYKKLVQQWSNLSKKRQVFYFVTLSLLLLIMIMPVSVRAGIGAAGIGAAVASLLGVVIGTVITILSSLITIELNIFAKFAQFNNFLGVTAVEEGWKLVRDLCNMFFIVILLVISFATILKLESYSYKKWLGKLVIAAILINFSKTITGFLIGFSQVIMLTFVSAFKDAVAGNLAQGLHLTDMMKVSYDNEGNPGAGGDTLDSMAVVGALALALALLTVFAVVMLIMIVVLVGRIVTLWVLVILSPIAYLLQASPFGEKYAKQWWQEFGKNLVSGPVLAFFLWLAFLTIQRSGERGVADMRASDNTSSAEEPEFITGISKTSYLMDYIVTIALLLAAIKLTQSMGVIGSSFAGKMQQNLGSLGKKVALGSTLGLAKYTDRKWGSSKLNRKLGLGGLSGHLIADKAKGIKESWAKSADDEKSRIRRSGALNATHSSGIVRALLGSGKGHADEFGPVGFLGIKGGFNNFKHIFSKNLDTHAKTSDDAEDQKKKYDEEMEKREIIELEIISKPTAAQDNLTEATDNLNQLKTEILEFTKKIEEETPTSSNKEVEAFQKELEEKEKKFKTAVENEATAQKAFNEWDVSPDQDQAKDDKRDMESIRNDREELKEIQIKMGKEKKGSKEYKKLKSQETAVADALAEKEEKYGLAEIYDPKGEGDFADKTSAELIVSSNHQLEIKKKADKKLSKLSMGRSLAARVEERSKIEEGKRNFSNVNAHPELIQFLDKALEKGEEFDAIGIMEKLAADGNENEFLKHYGYESGPIGLHKFVQEKLIKEKGMDDQLALGLQNDIGEIAKITGHWEVAETTDIDKTGKLKSLIKEIGTDENGNTVYDTREHTIRAHVEFSKRDNRRMMQTTNRLGIGSEDPHTGEFKISDLGRLIVLKLSQNHEFIQKRIAELNPNLLATITRPNVRKEIEAIIGKKSVLYEKLDDMTGKRAAVKDVGAATESIGGIDIIDKALGRHS